MENQNHAIEKFNGFDSWRRRLGSAKELFLDKKDLF